MVKRSKFSEKSLSPLGRKNFLHLIQHRLEGQLYTLKDVEKILRILINDICSISLPPIMHAELFLADGCNLNCTYCFEGLKPKRLMPMELAQRAVERLIKEWSGDAKEISITLFGGEPFLNWSVLKGIVEWAKEVAHKSGKYVSFSATTNGTLLNDERVRFLKDHQVFVMLSMDGLPEVHDRHRRMVKNRPSFALVWKGLQLLREHYETFYVRMTVMPDTAPLLFESVIFLSEHGVKNIVIVPAFGVEWKPDDRKVYWQQIKKLAEHFRDGQGSSSIKVSPLQDLEKIEELVKRADGKAAPSDFGCYSGCYAGTNGIAVTSSGEIFPCSAFVGSKELRESYRLGTVQGGLDNFRRQELYVLNHHGGLKCQQCSLRSFCQGTCMVANHYATGYLVEPDPMTCQKTAFYVSIAKRRIRETCMATGLICLESEVKKEKE